MTKFVFVQPHLRFGGAERQTVLVANRLAAEDFDVTVILHKAEGGLLDQLSSAVRVIDLGLASHGSIPRTALRLASVLRELPPSFIVVKLWSSILATALAEARGCGDHVFNYCEDLDPTDHARYIAFGRTKQALVGRIFRSKPYLTANTNSVADLMTQVYKLKQRPAVIPSTVDVDLCRQSAENASEVCIGRGRPIVVSVGSLVPRKQHELTIRAAEKLPFPVDVHIVGDGPLRESLLKMRDSLKNVQLSVHAGTANPYGFMQSADVLAHSASSEAWGIVLLEAMALDTQVVAANAIGPAEMLNSLGEGGLLNLVPVGDMSALSSAIEAALLRPRVDIAGPAFVSPYSVDSAVNSWVEHATNLLRG